MAAPSILHEVAPVLDRMIGCQIGNFRLLRRLGAGGMGTVYLASHVDIGGQMAIKILHPTLAYQDDMLARLECEARAVNLIDHENVLAIHDLRREGNLHYLVMEYLEGQPLSKMPLPMDAERAIPLLAQLCDALGAAHERGVIHRDVKAENVFVVNRPGRPPLVKLLDFGVAKLRQATGHQTAFGLILGTPAFMAPEQFRCEPLDGRSDLYAVGVLSYLLSTGVLPFPDRQILAMMRAHLDCLPPPPEGVRPGVNPRWAKVTLRALAKRPEDRHQDARSLRADLLSVLATPRPRLVPVASTDVPLPAPRSACPPPLKVDVVGADGITQLTTTGADLSMDGIFIATPGFAPRPFSTLRLTLHGPDSSVLRVEGEVVRHVTAAQASQWGMPEGVGVQFTRRTMGQKYGLAALMRGEAAPAETPVVAAAGVEPDLVLAPLRKRGALAGRDPYRLLDLPADAGTDQIRARARELRRALKGCLLSSSTAAQKAEAEAFLDRIARAVQTLTDPARRAELDAARGNIAGVARAIAEGLTVTELEQLRGQFLRERPYEASRAMLEATAGGAHEAQSDLDGAARAYERALRHDPLNHVLHQRLSAVRRQKALRSMALV